MDHGGKRKGAGRKPSPDKKQTVVLYIETSKIKNAGGMDQMKEEFYLFSKNFEKVQCGWKLLKRSNLYGPRLNDGHNAIYTLL